MPVTIDGTTGVSAVQSGAVDLTTDVTGVLPNANGGTGTATFNTSFKNRIINGAMMIDQRNAGASVTLSNSGFVYGVDRWAGLTGLASSSTITTQRVTINSNGFQYATRILRGSGTYTSTVSIIQEPESLNTYDLVGQTITISYWARIGSSSTATLPYIQLVSGTGTDQGILGAYNATWTGWTNVGTSVPTLTTTLTQYTATFTVPSNATELAVLFSISGYSGTGSANDFIDITGVQLEKGSTATSFDYRPYGTELQLCQRYFEKSFPINTAPANGPNTTSFSSSGWTVGMGTNRNSVGTTTEFIVTKRATPTMIAYGNSAGAWAYQAANVTGTTFSTAVSIGVISAKNFNYAQQVVDGAAIFTWGHWVASAEL